MRKCGDVSKLGHGCGRAMQKFRDTNLSSAKLQQKRNKSMRMRSMTCVADNWPQIKKHRKRFKHAGDTEEVRQGTQQAKKEEEME